jgi:energy-coupling factor transporter ATP-binding protein EcfA2
MTFPMPPSAGDGLSEKDTLAELLTWAKDRPKWQQDALRRLVLNDALTEVDIDDLVGICLDPKTPSQPITSAHVAAEGASGEPIALLRIENPTGINALAIDQKLEFAKDGLTVIYGDNGSGKSGYVRVLKHACRTRDRGTKILRDVEDTAATPQTAKIVFAQGAAEVDFAWTPDAAGHPDLPAVSIFDARSANIHVEKTNAVAYIPQPMQILEGLAGACDRVKAKLDAQVTALREQTPIALRASKLSTETAAGTFVHNLSAKSNLVQLALLATLSVGDQQRLSTLEADLAQDPKRAAARVANHKTRLDEQVTALKRLAEATSSLAFATRERLKAERDAKAEAAKLASDALFAASPLPEIGQTIWRSLWEAARKYSNEVAYPEKSFPDATAGGDLCVLCQQPLSAEAVQRRTTFESFVKGTTKADEERAARAYDAVMAKAAAARVPIDSIRQLQTLIATEIGDLALAEKVKEYGIRVAWRLSAFAREQAAPGVEPSFPEALSDLSMSLAKRAAQLSADQKSPEHLALVKEFRELKDREALATLLEDIKAEIERRKKADVINEALKDTAKKAVTIKNKDFSDKLVTNALRGRFAREIEKMKLARMPIELKKIKDQNAVSYFQVCLVEKPNEPVGEIFSEGEYRGVALAAFLAELVTAKRYSGIVFDDPMSSLDHIHRKAIAARLVEEAEHRQVIVFTHDLTFLYELRREAEAKERPIQYQTVRRKLTRPGYVEGELPNKAKSALQLVNSLRSELKEIKSQFDHWTDAKRTLFCKGFIEQLREAWDQGIADFIFPILGRFDNHIKGKSLFRLAILNGTDVKTVTAARGRLSEEMHVSAETLNPETVSHANLLAEIGKLEAWLGDIAQRQRDANAPVTSYS